MDFFLATTCNCLNTVYIGNYSSLRTTTDNERLKLDPSLAFTFPSSSLRLSSDVLEVLVVFHWIHSSLQISPLHQKL